METCPNCGYCKHCGRSWHPLYPAMPPYPAYPWWQQPVVNIPNVWTDGGPQPAVTVTITDNPTTSTYVMNGDEPFTFTN